MRLGRVGDGLNKALAALEEANTALEGVLQHIDFNRKVGQSTIPDKKLRDLIVHFSKYRLRNEDFEFPDLLGAAYEYLIGEFADSAGKKGGEFYTPRVRRPHDGAPHRARGGDAHLRPVLGLGRHADPVQGVRRGARRQRPRTWRLFGQENNGGVWSISKMNMLLHGIPDADIRNGDTLAEPLHTEGGELMRFDRVITNPPFSLNYTQDGIPFPERFRYGWCPEGGKKADLMFVQHMLAVLRPGGMVATVMPHGVLFRGGEEREIRTGLLDDDLLDAVIGLGPNLFYGTGIPACILVLRAKGAKPAERAGQGAVHQRRPPSSREGRAQNYLAPRAHREDRHGLPSVRGHPKLCPSRQPRRAARERRQPQHPPLRRQRAAARAARRARAPAWAAEATVTSAIGPLVDGRGGSLRQAADFRGSGGASQENFTETFRVALQGTTLLDHFAVSGVIASWWGQSSGPEGAAAARVRSSSRPGSPRCSTHGRRRPRSTRSTTRSLGRCCPNYLDQLAALEAKVAELDSTIKATVSEDDEDDAEPEDALSTAEIKKLKTKLTATRKQPQGRRRVHSPAQ